MVFIINEFYKTGIQNTGREIPTDINYMMCVYVYVCVLLWFCFLYVSCQCKKHIHISVGTFAHWNNVSQWTWHSLILLGCSPEAPDSPPVSPSTSALGHRHEQLCWALTRVLGIQARGLVFAQEVCMEPSPQSCLGLKHGLTIKFQLIRYLVCSPGRPQTLSNPPASAS